MVRQAKPPAVDEYEGLVGDFDIEETVEEYQQTASEVNQRDSFVKLAEGDNVLRFLPPAPGQSKPWVRALVHRIPGSNPRGQDPEGWDKRIVCTASLPGPDGERLSCPLCTLRERLMASNNPVDEENAKILKPKVQVWAEVVDLTTEDTAARGVQIFNYGAMIDEGLVGLLQGRFAFNFLHHQTGAPILIKREGSGINTRYSGIRALDREPIAVEWLRQRKDLQRFVKPPSREDMVAALAVFGHGPGASAKQAAKAPARTAPTSRSAPPAAYSAPSPAPARGQTRPKPAPKPEHLDDVDDIEDIDELDFDL